MNINPAQGAQPPKQMQPPPQATGADAGNVKTDFAVIDPSQTDKTAGSQAAGQADKTQATQRADKVDKADKIDKAGRSQALEAMANNKTLNPFQRIEQLTQEFDKFVNSKSDMSDTEHMQKLFWFQLQVQRAQFDVELVSKVVEHATSGAKTLLQTQA